MVPDTHTHTPPPPTPPSREWRESIHMNTRMCPLVGMTATTITQWPVSEWASATQCGTSLLEKFLERQDLAICGL